MLVKYKTRAHLNIFNVNMKLFEKKKMIQKTITWNS